MQERALTEQDISTLQAAVENLRGGSRDPERRAEAAFRIAHKLEQITKRTASASPASGLSDQEQVLVSWVRSHITFESIKGSDILKLLSIINRLSASPSVTEEEIVTAWRAKRAEFFVVCREGLPSNRPSYVEDTQANMVFGPATDERCYAWIEERCAGAVLALIRGERRT